MFLDFAPMEGITNAAFRRLHKEYFSGVDRYYMPFISPGREHLFTPRELRDILPENNGGIEAIPQIMTKSAEDFLWAAGELSSMGYAVVNLNAGCPSGTVTAKGKGAGMLADPESLDRFLDEVFSAAPCRVSVKTRLGVESPHEFDRLLEIYNKYPLDELIVHPRVRKDFYRNPVRRDAFEKAVEQSRNPLSFNGGIVTEDDYRRVETAYPGSRAIMLGQGLVSDPFLAGKIKDGKSGSAERVREFHDRLFEEYAAQFGSRNNAAKRMKELWFYLIRLFGDSQRHGKKLMKARDAEEYLSAAAAVFRDLPMLDSSAGGW